MFFRLVFICSCAFVLSQISGCANVVRNSQNTPDRLQAVPLLDWQSERFFASVVPDPHAIFELSEQQKQDFLDFYYAPETAGMAGHQRLFDYLERVTNLFDYRGDTFVASQAMEQSMGNCLSLAILTSALAQQVGIDIEYRKVHAKPVYSLYDDLMTLSTHVQTRIFQPAETTENEKMVFARPSLVIDYFPNRTDKVGDKVSRQDFVAMFYQNLASDALINKRYDLAYALLAKAMEQAPMNAETLNTLGVLFVRVGDSSKAERIYRYGIEHTKGSLNLYNNYANLLAEQGRSTELQMLQAKVDLADEDNPYKWVDLANQAYEQKYYQKALRYYNRALAEAPYLHEGYFGLAKTSFKVNKPRQAKRFLLEAKKLANSDQQHSLYAAKLAVLKQTH